jgi:tRNA threonylcarbamoyladenosine biosynthesis protein TsaE
MIITADNEDEMITAGERIAAMLPRRAVVLLTGNLGAGKTTLTKGIVKGLGAAEPEEVSSPTFTLIHEYGDPVRVYHIDLYRLDEERQLATLGLDEIFDREAVVLVEWADKFPRWMPPEHIAIHIEHHGSGRRITVTAD